MAFVDAEQPPVDYNEPTMGMTAMRVRIIRAEMQAGCRLSVFNALIDGDEAIVEYGEDNQPRATSTGALFSIKIADGQNNTYARDIRAPKWIFLERWFNSPFASYGEAFKTTPACSWWKCVTGCTSRSVR